MELESRQNIYIEHLPEELFYHITKFLTADELDACFDTCQSWRYLLNVDSVWTKSCLYKEKYFVSSEKHHVNNDMSNNSVGEICIWRQRFERQRNLLNNWTIGNYTVGNTGISSEQISLLRDFVDDNGNHWLFDDGHNGITIWNISSDPILLTKLEAGNNFGSFNLTDKILMVWSNYVRVFQFSPINGEAKLLYRFRFEMNSILNDDTVISDDDYESGVRYVLVGNYFVGYRENVTDIHSTYLHVWDCDKAAKIGVTTAFEQSFVDFVFEETGTCVVNEEFKGGLLLFPSDSDRFLVNLIDDRHHLCQISLFSTQELRCLNVVARLRSRTGWCFMKGDVVSIYHENGRGTTYISVYNVNGSLLTTLEFPKSYNPAFSDEFCFSKTKLFLKVADKVHVVSIIESQRMTQHTVQIKEEKYILHYFEPKFLLLYDKVQQHSSTSLTVLDVYTGQELWTLSNLTFPRCYYGMIKNLSYPNKLLVQFEGNSDFSILNFEKPNGKRKLKTSETLL